MDTPLIAISSQTVDQYKTKKALLETQLYKDVLAFEQATGLKVAAVNIQRATDLTCTGVKTQVNIQL